jgi:hypothetical protein
MEAYLRDTAVKPAAPAEAPKFSGEDSFLEQAATGIQAFGSGVSAHGTDIANRALGATGDFEARKEKYSKTAGAGEFAGEMLRAGLAVAAAGPIGLFLNGALNVAGDAADKAYAKDPRLTGEYVLHSALSETLGAVVGVAAPFAVTGIKATGRVVAGKAMSGLTKTLEPYAANFAKRGGKVAELAEQAAKDGYFAKTKAGAAQYAQRQMETIGSQMGVVHATMDKVSGGVLHPGIRKEVFRAAGKAQKELIQNETGDSLVRRLARDARKPEFSPSAMLRSERTINDAIEAATKANDGHTVNVLTKLKDRLVTISDAVMTMHGVVPTQYRALQTTYAGAIALKAAVGEAAGGEAAKVGLGFAAKEAAYTAVGSKAGPVGGAAAALYGLKGAGATAQTVLQTGPSLLRQGAYSAGSGLVRQLEQGAFAEYIGQTARQAAVVGVAGAAKRAMASKPDADAVVELLTQHATQPDFVKQQIINSVDGIQQLPQAHKDVAVHAADMALSMAATKLPDRIRHPNPLAAPSTRQLTPAEKKRVTDYFHGIVAPHDVLNHPTAEGIEAVRNTHPATYQAFAADLMSKLGPNAPINSPLRRLANKHGLDNSQMVTNQLSQALHDKAKQPPMPPGGQKNTARGTMQGRDVGRAAQTAQGQAQERKLAGE